MWFTHAHELADQLHIDNRGCRIGTSSKDTLMDLQKRQAMLDEFAAKLQLLDGAGLEQAFRELHKEDAPMAMLSLCLDALIDEVGFDRANAIQFTL